MQKKKVLAILLAVVMVLGLCSMASASAPTDRVQINNMMVDASLVEAETCTPAVYRVEEKVTDLYLENTEDVALLTTSTVNYPPIAEITLGSNSSINVTDDGTNVQYVLHVPNGSTSGAQNFVFYASESTTYSNLIVTYGGQDNALVRGAGSTISMTLTDGATAFDATWVNQAGTECTAHCTLTIDTSKSVAIYENGTDVGVYVTDATAELNSLTVGGVTRYTCAITLPANASNTSVDVQFKLASSGATATLGGVSPDSSKVNVATKTKTVTFNGVDFSSTKELVITNGSASRTYLVSAAAAGSTVTVHIALRTFLADEYLENRTNWYDGYGTSSVSSSEKTRLLGVASYLRGANVTNSSTTASAPSYGGNAPISKDTATGRMIFNENSYVTLTVPASYTVKDVLDSFTSNETYFPGGFYIQAAQPSYIEAMGQTSSSVMGEFDCGSASGWMYTVRTSSTDTDSALPNAAASTWPISNGVWIDWYYTAAYGMDFGYSMFG